MGVADLAKLAQKITRNLEIKTPLTPEAKDELLKQISGAYKIISEKEFEKTQHKLAVKNLDEEIDEQHSITMEIVAKYDRGYESKMVECSVTYKGNEVTFMDITTGEIVESREMTEAEQLSLSENRVDAESIIRQSEDE